MTGNHTVEQYSFSELKENSSDTALVLQAVERIAAALSAKNANSEYSYLHDYIDYRNLMQTVDTEYVNFGRFFMLQHGESLEYIGFLLCFDDLDGSNIEETYSEAESGFRSRFPIGHCEQFLDHDIPFLRDLYHLRKFAFVFQIGVLPEYQHEKGGGALIDAFEDHYEGREKAQILAGAIHERQYSIFNLLQKRRDSNGRYIFLDHYLDQKHQNQHWFRVVKLTNTHTFFRKINADNLPKTYNTVIPIQLNQAVNMVNDIITIESLGAKVLWSSFFNASDFLQKRYGMGKDNHSFFESLAEARNPKEYLKIVEMLKEITTYLNQKDSQPSDVISLTDSFKKKSYEVFFFDSDAHDHYLPDFNQPVAFSLEDTETLLMNFLKHDMISKRMDRPLMGSKEKEQLYSTLNNFVKAHQPEYEKFFEKANLLWQAWRQKLLITNEEEAILVRGIKITNQKILAENMSQETSDAFLAYQTLYKEIKNRRIIPPSVYKLWQEYLDLHQKLYKIDREVLDRPDAYWWCHAMIPINYSGWQNIVGIMFTFRCLKLEKNNPDYHRRMGKLASLISSALSKNMLNILIKFQQKATTEATSRYVIAAVTSRNLAHNYGSHILTRLDKQSLIEKLISQDFYGNFAEEIARFFSYLRIRTNLLADMSTSEPVSTVNRWLNEEVIKTFNQQAIVKKYISNSRLQKIQVNFRVNGQLKQTDVSVQIPNGDLGISAFCMILENIVRNSAKYEDISTINTLELSVDIIREDERGYFLAIYDHLSRKPEELSELVTRINELYIKKFAIGSRNNLRESGWGILEMSAAASYLRKKVPGVINSEEGKRRIPILQARPINIPAEPGKKAPAWQTLAYEIYLKKPRSILLIDIGKQLDTMLVELSLQRQDIKIINLHDVKDKPKAVHSHTFAVYFHAEYRSMIESNKRFPLRWILLEEEKERIQFADWLKEPKKADELMLWLWDKWLERFCRNKSLDFNKLELFVPALDKKWPEEMVVPLQSSHYLLYDDHREWRETNLKISPKHLGFYHAHRSGDPLGVILTNTLSLNHNQVQLVKKELLEAAITEIIIIDERIQDEMLRRSNDMGTNFFEELSCMNIHLPDPRVGEPDLYDRQLLEKLEEWLKNILLSRKIDFIILHLGILETWVGTHMDDISKWIDFHITNVDERPEIVFTTGRGKPHNFPSRHGFQPFDSIEKHIAEGPISKYHLVKTLFSSRTRMGV